MKKLAIVFVIISFAFTAGFFTGFATTGLYDMAAGNHDAFFFWMLTACVIFGAVWFCICIGILSVLFEDEEGE